MSHENEYYISDNETISSIDSFNDSDFDFECPKCGFEYNNFNESNYQPCIECLNNYCKNCSNFCEKCLKEICFRCSYYMDCCNQNICISCSLWCEECNNYICGNCKIELNCVNCDTSFCENHISKEHKINLCNECSHEFCYVCSELTYQNPCIDCIDEIEKIIDCIKLPIEINKEIISFL